LAQNADDPNPEPSPNRGATGTQTQTSSLRQPVETWDRLRTQLSDRGVQFGIRYDGEGFADISGGMRRGGTYLGNLNLQLTLDAQRLIGWPGVTLFLYGLGIHGGHPSSFVGDAQGVSNIEAPAKWKIEEGWVQQNLFGNRFSALFGRYDLNSEFYRLQSAACFSIVRSVLGPNFHRAVKTDLQFSLLLRSEAGSRSNRSKGLSFEQPFLMGCRSNGRTDHDKCSQRVMVH